jgi:multidrug efflux pump subunit AcrA (membrane-fusion protein)
VLSTTSDQQVVHLQVKAEQQQLAHVGERAPVTLPGGSVAHGRITSVGTVATESKESEGEKGGNNGGGSSPVISVTLTLDHPVARLDQAPVSVELVKNVAPNALTVPATALVATAGGGYAIETLQAGRLVEIPVTPGMFANGYVQIEGAGVREGMTVTESQ